MSGGPGLASHPDRRDDFAAALPQALHYAQTLGVPLLNILPGRLAAGHSRQACLATLAANLQLAADFFTPHGLHLCCEAINDLDMPGFLLRTPDEVAQLLADIPQAGIGLQIDIYHAARMNLDIPALLARHLPQTAHIQFADSSPCLIILILLKKMAIPAGWALNIGQRQQVQTPWAG